MKEVRKFKCARPSSNPYSSTNNDLLEAFPFQIHLIVLLDKPTMLFLSLIHHFFIIIHHSLSGETCNQIFFLALFRSVIHQGENFQQGSLHMAMFGGALIVQIQTIRFVIVLIKPSTSMQIQFISYFIIINVRNIQEVNHTTHDMNRDYSTYLKKGELRVSSGIQKKKKEGNIQFSLITRLTLMEIIVNG